MKSKKFTKIQVLSSQINWLRAMSVTCLLGVSLSLGCSSQAQVKFIDTVSKNNQSFSKSSFSEQFPKDIINEVWDILDGDFIDGSFNGQNWQDLRQDLLNRDYASKAEVYGAIKNALTRLGDPETRLSIPEEYENLKIGSTMKGPASIGININLNTNEQYLIQPDSPYTPAAQAGLLPNDQLVQIDGESIRAETKYDILNRISGDIGSTVTLTVIRAGQTLEIPVIREVITPEAARFSIHKQADSSLIGYIRFSRFNYNTASDIRRMINELESKNIDAYILDLRNNPGGLVFSSIEVARMFLNDGVIVYMVTRSGQGKAEKASGRALTDKPMVILVNGGTSAGAELLAGSLQQSQRARLIGQPTSGINSLQSIRPLSNDSSRLAVTIAYWLLPQDLDIKDKGLSPDCPVEFSASHYAERVRHQSEPDIANDPTYAKALDMLKNDACVTE